MLRDRIGFTVGALPQPNNRQPTMLNTNSGNELIEDIYDDEYDGLALIEHELDGGLFTVTRAWVEEFATERGAWTADQFRMLGLSWSEPSGWKDRVDGLQITQEARTRFEQRLTAKQVRHAESRQAQGS